MNKIIYAYVSLLVTTQSIEAMIWKCCKTRPKYEFYSEKPIRLCMLPADILKHIFSFVIPYESNEEFINRIKNNEAFNSLTYEQWLKFYSNFQSIRRRSKLPIQFTEHRLACSWALSKRQMDIDFEQEFRRYKCDKFALSNDLKKIMVSVNYDNGQHPSSATKIFVINLKTKKQLSSVAFAKVNACAFSSNGKVIYTCKNDNFPDIYSFDPKTNRDPSDHGIYIFTQKNCSIEQLTFNKQGTHLASNCSCCGTKIWDTSNLERPPETLAEHFARIGVCKKFPQN